MEKSEKSKAKDLLRGYGDEHIGYHWVRDEVPLRERNTSSGVVFRGHWERDEDEHS